MAICMQYRKPNYICEAARCKYGRRIQILGITKEEENRLWKEISVRAVSTGKLQQKSTTIVDVKTMSLVNKSSTENNCESMEKESAVSAYNEVEIGSQSRNNQASQKTLQIQLGTWSNGEIGDLVDMKLSEANYYNSTAAPITFKTGVLDKSKEHKDDLEEKSVLDKDYHVMEKLKIPPKTKLTAKILTKAVTYEVKMVTELRINANTTLPLRFKGRFEKQFGSFCTATIRSLSAKDLFCNEAGFKMVDDVITFTREGTVTYVSEEVEIITDTEEIM